MMRPLLKKVNRLFFITTFIVFIIISVCAGLIEYHKIRTEILSVMKARISVARNLIENTVFSYDSLIIPLIKHDNRENLNQIFKRLKASGLFNGRNIDNFFILNDSGEIVFISEPYSSYKGLNLKASIPTSDRQVNYYQSLLSKKSVVAIRYALANGYKIIIERSLDHFIPIMASFSKGPLYPGEVFFILSSDGRTIYHPNSFLMKTRHNLGFELKKLSIPDKSGLFSYYYNKINFIAIKETFPAPHNWEIYYAIPGTVMSDTIINSLVEQSFFIGFFFLILLYFLQAVVNKYFSRPVNQIVSALKQPTGEKKKASLSHDMAAGIQEFDTIISSINSRDLKICNTFEGFKAAIDGLDAIVYVADMKSYELIYLNEYGHKFDSYWVGKKCYKVLQKNQDKPCDFCSNRYLLDSNGSSTGVYVWEFQNTVDKRWYECRDQAIRWTDGRMVRMEIATDITERKGTAKALLEEKEWLAVTLRSIGDAVIATNTREEVLFINRVAEKLTGWSDEEARGKSFVEIFNIIDEKKGKKCPSPVRLALDTGKITSRSKHAALVSRNGTVKSIAESGAPIRNSTNKIIGVVLVFRDITKEKRTEQELLKIKKLESVGVLAGGIAHDFNNILTGILGNIELASLRIPGEDKKTLSILSKAEKAAMRASQLTRQLLTFAKGGEPVKETTSLPAMITESADFVLHGSKVVCNYNFPKGLWKVDADAGQISQVIQNIVINARQALPEGGTITITCENIDNIAQNSPIKLKKRNYVAITIKDHGIGIPNELIDKIFDPYFTSKKEGSGLGLAVCHSIINKHDGYITVDSTPGTGTTFTIYLPAIQHSDINEDQTTDTYSPEVKSARIMIMDDDKMVREITKEQLVTMGHEAVLVKDGDEAIIKYQEAMKEGKPIDLVIMDLTIPGGTGGKKGARRLLQIDPEAKIIVSSGYSNDTVMANHKKYGFIATLKKPFSLNELQNAINTAITANKVKYKS